jgi:hypothetical protein
VLLSNVQLSNVQLNNVQQQNVTHLNNSEHLLLLQRTHSAPHLLQHLRFSPNNNNNSIPSLLIIHGP